MGGPVFETTAGSLVVQDAVDGRIVRRIRIESHGVGFEIHGEECILGGGFDRGGYFRTWIDVRIQREDHDRHYEGGGGG